MSSSPKEESNTTVATVDPQAQEAQEAQDAAFVQAQAAQGPQLLGINAELPNGKVLQVSVSYSHHT